MKILYVEDNFANIAYVERIAQMGNHQVSHCTSAEAALRMDELHSANVILVDIKLDGQLDGVDFITGARAQGVTTPVVVITAYDTDLLRDRCFEAGCDHYFTKPIPVNDLRRVIEQYSTPADV